ncbi:MAG: hypothetical protein V4463_09570 [Pseudomonadota bacterium]
MHTHYQICERLAPKEKCFRVQIYEGGKFEEVFHEHIPSIRISAENEHRALQALALHYSKLPATMVLHSFLNKKGKQPAAAQTFQMPVEYPEPGVLRRYCSTGTANAWADDVILPAKFRITDAE